MVEVKIPYVVQRGRSWLYRRRPPPDVQWTIGKTNWLKTWRPGTPLAQVEREAHQLAARHDQEVAVARGEIETAEITDAEQTARRLIREAEEPDDIAFAIGVFRDTGDPKYEKLINTLIHGGTYSRETVSLSEALKLDQERHSSDKDPKPFEYAVQSFVSVIGDRDVTKITRADVSEWLAHERRRGLAPATIRRRLAAVRAVVNRIHLDLDYPGRNPFERHNIPGGRGSPSDRVPFSRPMLDLIEWYLDNAPRLHPDTRNLIRLMRNTGGGPGEIGGLAVADVVLDGPVPYLWIRGNSIRRLKTAVRDRQVPLIGVALEAAQDSLERATGPGLFEGYDAGGRGADHISARVNAALRRAGIPRSPRLTAYSFRHGIVEALRAAGVNYDLSRSLMGHAARDIHGRYGATKAQLVEARDAMEVALAHLGDIDDANYSEQEQME